MYVYMVLLTYLVTTDTAYYKPMGDPPYIYSEQGGLAYNA